MNEVRLDFILEHSGWARLELSAGSFSHTIRSISYLTDALDDLLRMGIDIATDKGWSTALFDHEPGGTVLVAETGWWSNEQWEHGARLSSFKIDSGMNGRVTWSDVRDAEREFVIPLASRDELAAVFLKVAETVFEEHGEEGYRRTWSGRLGFPVRAMSALKEALSHPAAPAVNYRPWGISPQ